MQNNQLTSNKILNCKHGKDSYFFPVSDEIGIKFFRSKSIRDNSYLNQSIAYLSNLAPKVGKKIDTEDFFGYYTERVKTLEDIYQYYHKIPNKIHKAIDFVSSEIRKCSDYKVDRFWKNFGFNDGNELICIDFGD